MMSLMSRMVSKASAEDEARARHARAFCQRRRLGEHGAALPVLDALTE